MLDSKQIFCFHAADCGRILTHHHLPNHHIMQISCQYQYSLSYLHPHMWLPPDMIFASPAQCRLHLRMKYTPRDLSNTSKITATRRNFSSSISLKASLKQHLLSVIDRYVHLFLCSQPILCRTKNGLFLSFLSTVTCSIPHSSQRSHPIHPTYSSTVLHPSIHPKREQLCGVSFSVSRNLRKRCVNLDVAKCCQQCVNHQNPKNFSKEYFC